MNRLTDPGPNGSGKKAWRHLNDAERAMLARYAAKHGRQAAIKTFGISESLVNSCCAKFNLKPAPHKFLDLAAIARAAETMPREEVASRFRCCVSTVSHACRLHRQERSAA